MGKRIEKLSELINQLNDRIDTDYIRKYKKTGAIIRGQLNFVFGGKFADDGPGGKYKWKIRVNLISPVKPYNPVTVQNIRIYECTPELRDPSGEINCPNSSEFLWYFGPGWSDIRNAKFKMGIDFNNKTYTVELNTTNWTYTGGEGFNDEFFEQ